jgi:hypothetical protein
MPVPGHVFSVDANRLRYAKFNRVDGALVLGEVHQEELQPDEFVNGPLGGQIRDVDRFGHSLENLLSRLSMVPEAASLVVPDRWLRVGFTELEKLPRGTEIEDVLRFKLKRLVPFRVDDLRVASAEVPGLDAGQNRPKRLILGFGIDALFTQLEKCFKRRGVSIGHLSSESLALLPALEPILRGCLGLVAYVTGSSYSLVLTSDALPALHRFKPLGGDESSWQRLIPRDLGLTASFVRRELKGRRLGEAVLVASPEDEETWGGWLEAAFQHPVRAASEQFPNLPGGSTDVAAWDALPLFGAASRGVS